MDRSSVLHDVYELAFFSYLPVVVLFIAGFIKDRHLIIRAPNLKLNYSFARWGVEDRYAASIWVGVISFLILMAVKHVFRQLDIVALTAGPALLTIAGTVALSIEYFKISEFYERYAKSIKILFVFSAVLVSYQSSVMTNATIAEYTHTNASNFPDAQKVITILASFGIWLYAAVIISFVAYIFLSILSFAKMITHELDSTRETRYNRCLVGVRPMSSARRGQEIILLLSLLLGASMTVSAPLAYFKLLKVSSIDVVLKGLLVESSFQLSPSLCSVETPEGSLMSLLPFRQAAIAIPDDELGYNFAVIECSRKFDALPAVDGSNNAIDAKSVQHK